MVLYVNEWLASRFTRGQIAEAAWDFMCDGDVSAGGTLLGREVKTITPFVHPSAQGGVYVSHPSLKLDDEVPLLNYLERLRALRA